MSMVTLSWIVHTGYLLQVPQQNISNPDPTEAPMPDQVQDTTMKTGTGEVIPDYNLILTDIAVRAIMIHTEATPGNSTGTIAATPGVTNDGHAPHIEIIAINPATAHHTDPIADCPHTEVLQLTTQRDHSRSHWCPSYKSSRWDLHRSQSHSSRSWSKPYIKKNLRVKMEDPHTNYYSSDDHSCDSGEIADHLN